MSKRPPRPPATAFGGALKRAMTVHRMTCQQVGDALGVAQTTVSAWRNGALPTRARVADLANLLDAPGLVTVARQELTRTCAYCGRVFVQSDTTGMVLYCSKGHRSRDQQEQERRIRLARRPETVDDMKGRILNLETELDYATRERDSAVSAIAAFCRRCEWDGICKTPACELRDESPLPLAQGLAA